MGPERLDNTRCKTYTQRINYRTQALTSHPVIACRFGLVRLFFRCSKPKRTFLFPGSNPVQRRGGGGVPLCHPPCEVTHFDRFGLADLYGGLTTSKRGKTFSSEGRLNWQGGCVGVLRASIEQFLAVLALCPRSNGLPFSFLHPFQAAFENTSGTTQGGTSR